LADQIPKLQKLNDNKKTFNLDDTVSYVNAIYVLHVFERHNSITTSLYPAFSCLNQ